MLTLKVVFLGVVLVPALVWMAAVLLDDAGKAARAVLRRVRK